MKFSFFLWFNVIYLSGDLLFCIAMQSSSCIVRILPTELSLMLCSVHLARVVGLHHSVAEGPSKDLSEPLPSDLEIASIDGKVDLIIVSANR